MSTARELVYMLIQRHRAARAQLRRARAAKAPTRAIDGYTGAENEAHNAAEIARRMLYGIPR